MNGHSNTGSLESYQTMAKNLEAQVALDESLIKPKGIMLAADAAATVLVGAMTIAGLTSTFESAKEGFFPSEERIASFSRAAKETCETFRPQLPAEGCVQRQVMRMEDIDRKYRFGEAFAFGLFSAAGVFSTAGIGLITNRVRKDYSELEDRLKFNIEQLELARDRIVEMQRYPFGKPKYKTNDLS